jgi:murein DD-endopeptidase MepM/ murein hydrolase activator NlpD
MPISDQLKGALNKYSTQYKDDTVQGKFTAPKKQDPAAKPNAGKFGGNKQKPQEYEVNSKENDDRVLDLMDQYETTANKNAQKDVEATKNLQQTVSSNHQTTEDNADFRATAALTQDKQQNKQLGRLNSTVGDLYRLLYNEIHKPNVGKYTSKHGDASPEIDELAAQLARQHKELMRKLGDCCGGGGFFGGGTFGKLRDRLRRRGRGRGRNDRNPRGPSGGGPDLDPELDVDIDNDRDRDRDRRNPPDPNESEADRKKRERRERRDARRRNRPRGGGKAKIAALVGGGLLALGGAIYMGKKHQEEYPEETAEQNRREDEDLPELEGQELIDFRSNITRKMGRTPDPATGYALSPTQQAAVASGQYTVEQATGIDESDLYDQLKEKGITAPAPDDTSVGTAAAVAAGATVTAAGAYSLLKKEPAPPVPGPIPPAPPAPPAPPVLEPASDVAARLEREAAERTTRETTERTAREAAEQTARESVERTAREAAEQTAREAAERAGSGPTPPVPEGSGSWLGKAGRWAGRLVAPAVTAYDAYGIVTDEEATTGEKAGELTDLAGGVAAGWAGGELGAAAGGALGLLGGPFAPITVPVGAFLGGLGGGILGYMGGEALTEKARESVTEAIDGSDTTAEDITAQPVVPSQIPKDISAVETPASVDRMAELKQQDVKQAEAVAAAAKPTENKVDVEGVIKAAQDDLAKRRAEEAATATPKAAKPETSASTEEPVIDTAALDAAMANAAQFASAGSANVMSDVTTLADPNNMLSGVLGTAEDVTSQPASAPQPVKTVEASETETQAQQNELIKAAVKKVNEVGPDKKTVGVADVDVQTVKERSPEFRVIGEAVAEKIDDVKDKATEIGKDGSAIAVINAVGNVGTYNVVAAPLDAGSGGAGYGDIGAAADSSGPSAMMGGRWSNPSIRGGGGGGGGGGFIPGSQGTPAVGGGMIGGGAGGGVGTPGGTGGSTGSQEVAKVSTDTESMMSNVYSSFTKAGFSENQAKALTAEVGRENGFQSKYIYGDHGDAANAATNTGFFSWQGDRKKKLQEHLASKGLMKDGKMVQGQASLDAMAEFAKGEMESGQYKGLGDFMQNKNVDSETAAKQLGKGYIKWAYGQDRLRNGASFDWRAHDKKRAGYYNKIDQMVGKNKAGDTQQPGAQQPGTAQQPGAADVTSTQAMQGGTSYKSLEEYAEASGYGKIGDRFGPRQAPKTTTGRGSSNHKGIDIKPKTRGENVGIRPLEGGVVQSAGPTGGYGNSVVVKHADGTTSRYAHLHSMDVKPGDTVGKDQVIGKMGTTGNSSGVHLHMETTDAQGNKVDPDKWLAQRNAAQQAQQVAAAQAQTPQNAASAEVKAQETQAAAAIAAAQTPQAAPQTPQVTQNAPQAPTQMTASATEPTSGAGAAVLAAAAPLLGGVDPLASINAAKADQRSFVPPTNPKQPATQQAAAVTVSQPAAPAIPTSATTDPTIDTAALDAAMANAAQFASAGPANTMSDVTNLADPNAMVSGVLSSGQKQPDVLPTTQPTATPATTPQAVSVVSQPAAPPAIPASPPLAIRDDVSRFGFKGEGQALAEKKGFVMHHTGKINGGAEGVKKVLQQRNLATQFVIDREGNVTRMLQDGTRGAHMKGDSDQTELNKKLGLNNSNTEGVEIIADDDADILPVQAAAAARLAAQQGYKAEQIYGHGELNSHKQATEGSTAAKRARELLRSGELAAAEQSAVAPSVAQAATAATKAATAATQAAADVSKVQQTNNAFVGNAQQQAGAQQASGSGEGGMGAAALSAASPLFGGANVLGMINAAKADQARMFPGAASSPFSPTSNGGITANAASISASPLGASAGMMCNAASQPTASSPASPLGQQPSLSMAQTTMPSCPGTGQSGEASQSSTDVMGNGNANSTSNLNQTATSSFKSEDASLNTIAPSLVARDSASNTSSVADVSAQGGSSNWNVTPYAFGVSSQTINETPAQREKHASVQTVRVADSVQSSSGTGDGKKELPKVSRTSSADSYSPKNNQSNINDTPTLVSDFGLTFLNSGFI